MWRLVQSKYAATNSQVSSLAVTFDTNVTPGNLVVAFIWCYWGQAQWPTAFTSTSDTGKILNNPSGVDLIWPAYIKNATGGEATYTATFSGNNQFNRLWVAEFEGGDTSELFIDSIAFRKVAPPTTPDGLVVGVVHSAEKEALAVAIAWNGNSQDIPAVGSDGWRTVMTTTSGDGDAARITYKEIIRSENITTYFTAGATNDHDCTLITFCKPWYKTYIPERYRWWPPEEARLN